MMRLFFNFIFYTFLILGISGCDNNLLTGKESSTIGDSFDNDSNTNSSPTLSYTGSSGTIGTINVAMSVSPTTLSNNGSAITSCTVSPSLPIGLVLNITTCVISGTPTVLIANTSFTVTITNATGSTNASISLSVSAAPTLSYAGSTGTSGTINVAMSVSPTTLSSNGSAITNCTVSPGLPSGLVLNTTTCVISGTPTVSLANTSFTVTATNLIGSTNATVSLSVLALAPTLSYAGSTGTSGTVGVAMSVSPTTLSSNGSTITNCTALPSLPSGLILNTTTCVISGTPTASIPITSFAVTATNLIGSTNGSVSLSVSAAPTLSYAGSSGTSGTINVVMSLSPTTLSSNGSAITNCTVSPGLPSGLVLNTTTCVISGTPTVLTASTIFTVTATNAIGSTNANVSLSVSAAPTLSYSGSTGTSGTINIAMSVSPTTLSSNGSAITNCTVSPSLPSGLVLNTTTCVISGTPTVSIANTSFTVTVTNLIGSTNATVSLSVLALAPTLSYAGSTATSGTINIAMSVSPTTLSSNGSTITNCTVSPSLPIGLVLNTTTCVISGTPTVSLANTSFTVTVTNSIGSINSSVSLSVSALAPTLSYTGSSGTSGTINVAMSVSPTTLSSNGSAITNCTVSPGLPSGLVLNTTTCVISGTPTVLIANTSFAVTATNLIGSTNASVSLSVSAAPTLSYAGSTGTSGTVGVAMSVSPTTLSSNGSAITNCTVSPSLPSGLVLNATTCVISGTPIVSISSTTFTVTATNSIGSTNSSVSLSVLGLVLVGGAYQYSDGTFATTCLNYFNSPAYSGQGDGKYRIDPLLAGGADFVTTCDMANGGWTLVYLNRSNDTLNPFVTDNSDLEETDPSSALSDANIVGLANLSSQVRFESIAPSSTITEVQSVGTFVIGRLRSLLTLSNVAETSGTTVNWTGPGLSRMTKTCGGTNSSLTANTTASLYHACGNASGLHVGGNGAKFNFSGGEDTFLMLVR